MYKRQVSRREQEIIEIAAILHDIACPLCREKYGNTNGKYQEKEGAVLAREFLADCGLPEDEHLIQYGDSLENSACACLDQLLERKCDAIIVCQGLMASETIIYLHQKGIQLAQDIDLVSFVDYDSDVYALYANQMDSIIQPVEDLGLSLIHI